MDDLVQFLRDRYAEEALWTDSHDQASPRWYYDGFAGEVRDHGNDGTVAFVPVPRTARHIARNDPARALAELDAKRRLLDEYEAARRAAADADEDSFDYADAWVHALQRAVQLQALPHADHPKYQDHWRPRVED